MKPDYLSPQEEQGLRAELKARVDALYLQYIFPVLATVRAGEDPEAVRFEAELLAAARDTGVRIRRYMVPADTEQDQIARLIREINGDRLLSALVLIQPLPADYDREALAALTAPEKDVTGENPGSPCRSRVETPLNPTRIMGRVIDAAERSAR